MINSAAKEILSGLGYEKILTFEKVPCDVYYDERKKISLSVGEVEDEYWLKASKHFLIKAMQTVGDTVIYSKLQQITSLMEYLKTNVAEFQCSVYYIGDITPRIAYNNFPAKPQLIKYEVERQSISRSLGPVEPEQKMQQNLFLLKNVGTHDNVVKQLELTLAGRQQLKERLAKLDGELSGAASVLNEWVEKGHAIALLWRVSTTIRICSRGNLEKSINDVQSELKNIEDFSVKSRAHQQGLWIEELADPFYCFYAESLGLFHPMLARSYQDVPFLGDFAAKLEDTMNARITAPIQRPGFTDQPSSSRCRGSGGLPSTCNKGGCVTQTN